MNIQGYRPPDDNRRIKANNEQLLQVHVPEDPARIKRDPLALTTCIISLLLLLVLWPNYFYTTTSGDTGTFSGLASVFMALFVLPHMLLSTAAFIFAAIYWFSRAAWCVLVAAILYTIAGAILFSWAYDVVLQMVMCYAIVARKYKSKSQ